MKESDNKIHIGCAFDQNYITPVYVVLTSIFQNNRNHAIHFHLIATGLTDLEKTGLSEYIEKNSCSVSFYSVNEEELKQKLKVPESSHYTIATYYRLMFPLLVAGSTGRLLYIDTDTIVLDDLVELFYVDTESKPVAAVPDPYPSVRYDLGIHTAQGYFNAGVLVMNIVMWNAQSVTEKAIRYAVEHPENIVAADQDALNAVLVNNWKAIDPRYNVNWLDVKLQIPTKKLLEGKVIIHYTSRWKPWHCLATNKLRSQYHYYLKRSPRSKEKKYTDFKWEMRVLIPFLRIRAKEKYFDWKINKVFPLKSLQHATNHY